MANEMKYCRQCGAQMSADTKFCRYCGYQFPSEPQKTALEATYCQSCGKENAQGAQFCRYCGKKIGAASRPQKQDMQKARTAVSAQNAPTPAQKADPAGKGAAVQKGKRKTGGFAKFLCLLLAATVAFTGFVRPGFFLKGRKDPDQHISYHPAGNDVPSQPAATTGLYLVDSGRPSPDADKVTLTVSGCLIEGDAEYTVTALNMLEDKNNGIKGYVYDISCDQIQGNLNGFMEIRIPYDDSFFDPGEDPGDCLMVHVIDDEGKRQLEMFDVDKENKEVVIYAEHLSTREVFHYRNPSVLEKYDISFGNTIVGNLNFNDCASLVTGFINDINEMDKAEEEYYFNKEAISILLKAGLGGRLKIFPKDLNNYINDVTGWLGNAAAIVSMGGEYVQSYMGTGLDALSKLGLYTSMCKLSYALSDLSSPWRVGCPSKEEVVNLYKTSLTSGLDYVGQYFSGGWIGPKFTMHMSVVFVLGMLIDSMFEEAMYQRMYEMGEIYEYFEDTYSEGDYRPRTNKEWYDLFMDIFERYTAASKQDYIEEAIDRELYLYATRFWSLSQEEADYVADAAGYKRRLWPTPEEQEKLTETYTENLRYRLHPVVLQCEKTMAKRAEAEALVWLRKAYDAVNKKVSLELKDGHDKVQYGGYYFSFDNLANTADRSIWQGQLDKDGRFTTSFNLNDWINAGVPTTVSLYATEKDRLNGKNAVAAGRFVPAKDASDITTVVFEDAGEESFEIRYTHNGVTYTINVEGAIAYGESPKGLIYCQAKPGASVDLTITASDGSAVQVRWRDDVKVLSSGEKHRLTMGDSKDLELGYWCEITSETNHSGMYLTPLMILDFFAVDAYTEKPLINYEPSWSDR